MMWRTWQTRFLIAAMVGVASLWAAADTAAQGAAPRLILQTNQPAFGPGADLSVTVGLQHTGPPVSADLYFGVILPDGDSVIAFEGLGLATREGRLSNLASLRPLLSGLGIATDTNIVVPDFFRYTFRGNEPIGRYEFFFAATTPGALRDGQVTGGELLTIQRQSFLNLPRATVTTDAGHAGSAVIGPAGGTVTTTAANGTVYTLTVPRNAVETPTTISLTPLTSLGGWPVPVELAAGVRGAPDGLRFAIPARLVVDLPQPLVGDVLGMPMPDSGAGFTLVPVARSGRRLQVMVEHFSIVAIPRTLADLAALIGPSSRYAQAQNLTLRATLGTDADVRALLAFLTTWYDTVVDPLFLDAVTGSGSDEARLAALEEFRLWEDRRVVLDMAMVNVVLDGVPVPGRLVGRAAAGRPAALITLVEGYQRLNLECRLSTAPAVDRLRLADRAAGFVLLGDTYLAELDRLQDDPDVVQAPPLDLQAAGFTYPQIRASLCALEVVHEVLEPNVPAGGTGSLRVRAGTSLAGQPTVLGSFMRVAFHADPAAETPTTRATTDQDGFVSFPVTADGNGTIRYKVCAFFDNDQFPSGLSIVRLFVDGEPVCRSSVTGVVVTPSQTEIVPFASRQFSATVEGTNNQAVTWSVSGGGSISSTGLFTSNGTLGTFFVTATSTEDPNSIGVAQIIVNMPCTGLGCAFQGSWTSCETVAGIVVCQANPLGPVTVVAAQLSSGAFQVTVRFACGLGSSVMNTFRGPVQPSGAFMATQTTGPCSVFGTMTGQLTASSLQFTLPTINLPNQRTFIFTTQ